MNNSWVITLREYQQLKDINMDKTIAEGLRQEYDNIITVSPTTKENVFNLTAKSIIGVIHYHNVIIQIKPKVDVPIIWDWLVLAFDLKSIQFHKNQLGFDQMFGSLEWIVRNFIAECKRIYSRGIIRGYVTKEEPLKTIRGQWQSGKTYQRWLKHDYQFDCKFDGLNKDVIENQIIAVTMKDILKGIYFDSEIYKECRLLLDLFGEEINPIVMNRMQNPIKQVREIDNLPRTRLNVHYDNAFQWAKLYWKATSLSFDLGKINSHTFLLDMNELFELYIGKRIKQELKPFGITVTLQKQDTLAESGRIRIIPDLILKDNNGKEIIIDLKYISRSKDSSINSNVFQMLAYQTARQSKFGILLYAGGNEREDRIKNSEFVIFQWSMNLDKGLDRDGIELSISKIVDRLVVMFDV